MRRHTQRVATRFAVLLAGDLAAVLAVRVLFDLLESSALVVAGLLAPTLLTGDPGRFALLVISVAVSLFVTGSHSRHRALNGSVRLFVASAIAPIPFLLPTAMDGGASAATEPYILTVIAVWVALMLVRGLSERILRYVWPRQMGAASAMLVGRPDGIARPVEQAISAPGGDFRVIGHVSTGKGDGAGALGKLKDLAALIDSHEVEAVVICDELPRERMKQVLDACMHAGCQILYPARAVHLTGVRPTLVWHHDQPFFEIGSPVLKAKAVISKRILDSIVSPFLLVLFAPAFLVLGIAIRMDSPGPVLFLQERAGLGGRRFRMLKFRTMRVGADDEKAQLAHLNGTGDTRLFKIREDPRITRLGRFLRRWSADELPQLWNVLIGDMSLVGPRPFFESDFDAYEEHHFRRLDAKPGITGLWQVSGRSEMLDFEDVIYLDRQYIEQWSFWLDISILFRTVPAVLRRTGAY